METLRYQRHCCQCEATFSWVYVCMCVCLCVYACRFVWLLVSVFLLHCTFSFWHRFLHHFKSCCGCYILLQGCEQEGEYKMLVHSMSAFHWTWYWKFEWFSWAAKATDEGQGAKLLDSSSLKYSISQLRNRANIQLFFNTGKNMTLNNWFNSSSSCSFVLLMWKLSFEN